MPESSRSTANRAAAPEPAPDRKVLAKKIGARVTAYRKE